MSHVSVRYIIYINQSYYILSLRLITDFIDSCQTYWCSCRWIVEYITYLQILVQMCTITHGPLRTHTRACTHTHKYTRARAQYHTHTHIQTLMYIHTIAHKSIQYRYWYRHKNRHRYRFRHRCRHLFVWWFPMRLLARLDKMLNPMFSMLLLCADI